MDKIIVLGASGHACVAHDVFVNEGKYHVEGFVDPEFGRGAIIQGVPVLGSDEDIPNIVKDTEIKGFFVAIGNNYIREKVVRNILSLGLNLELVSGVHTHAFISPHAKMGAGVIMMPGSVVNAGCAIANGAVINTGATIDHDTTVQPYAHIAPGVHLGGNCSIGYRAYLGLGASVIHGITVGDDVVVGAGSVVIHDIEKLSVVYGAPAKTMRFRESNESYL